MSETIPEDSMSPPPEISIIQEYYPTKSAGDIENILLQTALLNGNNVFHEPTCMICSCSNREDVEKKWLETKKHEDTKQVFKSKSTLLISNDLIDNHMRNHYDKGVKEQIKLEYVSKIKRLNSVELTTLDRIRIGLSMLTERLIGINSISPDSNLSAIDIEQMKSAETARIMGSFNQLLKLQASIMGEMKDTGQMIMLPRQAFVDTFNQAIVEAKSNEEKETIKKLLNRLAELNKKTQ